MSDGIAEKKRRRKEPNWDALNLTPSPRHELSAFAKAKVVRDRQIYCLKQAGRYVDGMSKAKREAAYDTLKREWRRESQAKQAHVKRLHSQRLRLAMPAWADRDAIREIYAEAQRLTRETGIPHEVDHIAPLLGKHCSGLHVHENLQILTRTENRRKSNR